MNSLQNLINEINHLAKRIQNRNIGKSILTNWLLAITIFAGISIVEQNFFSIAEKSAFIYFFALIALFILIGLVSTIYFLLKSFNYSEFTGLIERKTRCFKDALNGAANLIDTKKRDLSPLEFQMVAFALHQFKENKLILLSLIPKWFNKKLVLLALVSVFIIIIQPTFLTKAYHAFLANAFEGESYITPITKDLNIRKSDTIKLQAKLNRNYINEKPLEIEIINVDGNSWVHPLTESNGYFYYNAYDVQLNFKYRIKNNISSTPFFQVSVYETPSLLKKKATITPPSYTKIESSTHEYLEYLAVPENSNILFQLETNKDVAMFFKTNDEKRPFSKQDLNNNYFHQSRFDKYAEYSIYLIDKEQRELETHPKWIIEIIPDTPPIIEFKSPTKDINLLGVEDVMFEYLIYDDYGISSASLVINIPRKGKIRYRLNDKKTIQTTLTDKAPIDLTKYALRNGDLISYYIEAVDNKEKKGQLSVSRAKFIHIVPGEYEKDKQKADQGEQKGIRIEDLVAESKRLYRDTLANDYEVNEKQREENYLLIANELSDLRVKTKQRLDQLKEKLPAGTDIGIIALLFTSIDQKLKTAERNLRDHAYESSLENQFSALENFLKLSLLLKNEPPEPPKDQKEQKNNEGENSSEQSKGDQKVNQKVAEWLELLLNIKQENTNDNKLISDKNNLADDDIQHFSDEKMKNAKILQTMAGEMHEFKEFFYSADIANQIAREFNKESFLLKKRHILETSKNFVKSNYMLDTLIEILKKELEKSQKDKMDQAQDEINEALKKQSEIMKESGETKSNQSDKLKELSEQQQNLSKRLENIQNLLNQIKEEEEKENPSAAKSIENMLKQIKDAQLDKKIDKASKAIFYGLMDKAEAEQQKIMENLNQIADQMGKTKSQLQNMSMQELAELMQKLEQLKGKANNQGEGESAKELQNILKEQKQEAKEQSPLFNDLLNLASEIEKKPGQAGITTQELITEAIQIIEQLMIDQQKKEKIKSLLKQQLPPDQFRKLVEEYLENLSNRNY